jgi:HD-GYP domain-containing protein (c-di-GMP phosphodiesterase class II)
MPVYVPIPIDLLQIGKPMPVTLWSSKGQMLLRAGNVILDANHRHKLHGFDAAAVDRDALAWQRAYERQVNNKMREGASLEEVNKIPMPSAILPRDYVLSEQLTGGWMDLQEFVRGILYQGGLAMNPMARLDKIELRMLALLNKDPDEGFYSLFQALYDTSMGYSATNAMLCACIVELTARRLDMDKLVRQSLMNAAIMMNIGMAREQDSLVRQVTPLTAEQRTVIKEHPAKGEEILKKFQADDKFCLDIVRWHHEPESPEALPETKVARQILHMADAFVAMTAGRRSRSSKSPLNAARSSFMGQEGETAALSAAMGAVVGAFPPGTYVKLGTGEIALVVKRGLRGNTPFVIPIMDKSGYQIFTYTVKATTEAPNNVVGSVGFEEVKVPINDEKVKRARERMPPVLPPAEPATPTTS